MIKQFIQKEVIFPRIKQNGILAVYDPERLYRDLCLELVNNKFRVIVESNITSWAPTFKNHLNLRNLFHQL